MFSVGQTTSFKAAYPAHMERQPAPVPHPLPEQRGQWDAATPFGLKKGQAIGCYHLRCQQHFFVDRFFFNGRINHMSLPPRVDFEVVYPNHTFIMLVKMMS